MNKKGWVRFSTYNNEVNIQANDIRQVHRCLKILINKGVNCEILYFDTPIQSSDNIVGKNLDTFISKGTLPPYILNKK